MVHLLAVELRHSWTLPRDAIDERLVAVAVPSFLMSTP